MNRISKVTFLLLFLGSMASQAGWDVEILRGKDAPKGYKEAGILQRYVNTDSGRIQIGTITTAVYKKDSMEPKTEDDFAKRAESLIQGLKWKKQKYKGVSIYSAYLEQDLVQFKMMIKDQGDQRIFTLSNIRQPFAAGTSLEAEFLQRVFMKRQIDLLKGGKKTALIWSQFIQDLEAQSIGSFLTAADLSRMLTTFESGVLGGARDLGGVLTAAKGMVGDARMTVRQVGDAAQKSANALERADGRIKTFNETFARQAEKLNANLADAVKVGRDAVEVGDRAVDAADAGVREMKNFNGTLKKITGLSYIAQASAVSELAKISTNFLVNFAAGGLYSLLVKAYQVATASLSEEERQKINFRTDAAMKLMKEAMNQIGALDVEISVLTMGLSEVTQLDGKSLLYSLDRKINVLTAQRDNEMENLKRDPTGPGANACSDRHAGLSDQLFYLESLRKALATTDTKEKMCKKFESTFGAWRVAINSLQQAKDVLDQELTTVLDQHNEKSTEAQAAVASYRYKDKKCNNTQEGLIASYKELAKMVGCSPGSTTDDCLNVFAKIKEADGSDCAELMELQRQAKNPASLARMIEGRNAAVRVIKANLLSISKLDCVAEGDGRPQCNDNKDGDITLMNKLYAQKLEDLKTKCPPGSFNPIAGLDQKILANRSEAKPYTAQIAQFGIKHVL
jgi:hypothetical protein